MCACPLPAAPICQGADICIRTSGVPALELWPFVPKEGSFLSPAPSLCLPSHSVCGEVRLALYAYKVGEESSSIFAAFHDPRV